MQEHMRKSAEQYMNALISAWDAIGFIAACLVFATFYVRDMMALRTLALCSNLAFIIYGLGHGLMPIWLLHALLLPVNAWRLWQNASVGSRCEARRRSARRGAPSLSTCLAPRGADPRSHDARRAS
jgi:hypothetical protein